MKIQTTYFGEQAIDEAKILTFGEGLPGHESRTRFALLPEQSETPVFYFLQSVDDPDLAFTVGFATQFGISFDDTLLTADEAARLAVEGTQEVVVMLLISENRESLHRRVFDPKFVPLITSPLIVNPKTRNGLYKQLRGIRCSARVTADNTAAVAPVDPLAESDDYMRFLAVMQAGVRAA